VNTVKWFVKNAERVICAVLTLVMLSVLSLAVFSRYVFNMSISWAEELSIFCMIWLTYFGAAIAVQDRRHLRVTVIELFLSAKQKKILNILSNAVFLGFCLFIANGAFKMTILAHGTSQIGVATGIPVWAVIAGMTTAFALMALRLAQDTIKLFAEYGEL
jgi:TRAP-type C4-dicarboxylate transport system permease small subunit